MAKRCRSCCGGGPQYCITSMKFYGCSDVTGFTCEWFLGWTTGTTPVGATLEATTTTGTFPHCYTPSVPTGSYSVRITKAGWITQIVRLSPLGSTTFNFAVQPAPTTLAVTHDNGAGTMTTTTASPTVGVTLVPIYNGCFTGSGSVACQAVPATAAFAGTYAFTLKVQKGAATGGCNGASLISCLQTTPVANSSSGLVRQSSTCSGINLASSCAGGVGGTNAVWSDTVTNCNSPLNVNFHWTLGSTAPCDGGTNTQVGTNTATVTF